jgi:MFS family permease
VTRWVSERFGSKQVWLFSLALFLAASALSGAAWNMSSLIVFRLIQGIAAGFMIPILTTRWSRRPTRSGWAG